MKRTRFDRVVLEWKHRVLQLYERPLRDPVPVVRPTVLVRTAVYRGASAIGQLDIARIGERLARGDTLFAAFHGQTLAGYLFAASDECPVSEIDDVLRVAPKEVYLYDACTIPGFRGRRIYPHLLTRAQEHFRRESYDYAMIFAERRNRRSQKGIVQTGFRQYGDIVFWNILGWRRWCMEIGERHVGSRLHVEN